MNGQKRIKEQLIFFYLSFLYSYWMTHPSTSTQFKLPKKPFLFNGIQICIAF